MQETTPESVRTPPNTADRERLFVRPDSTHDVEIDETDEGQTEITVPISSTTEHRSSGKMTDLALESMASQLQDGTVGLWDDHGLDEMGWPEYRREDMYGWWVDGHVEDDVLYGTARLREGDERADDLVDQLDQGMPVGFSVGYIPLKDEWVEREEGEVREIVDVDLLETSPVGIPDNPDAVAEPPARLIARSLEEEGVDFAEFDRQTASTVAAGVTDALTTMSEDTPEGGDDPDPDGTEEQHESTDPENRQYDDEEVAEIMEIVGEHLSSNVDTALNDIQQDLANADEDDEEDDEEEADADEEEADADEEEDDGEGEDDDDDEEESARSAELEELRSELQEVRDTNEDLRAKVDRLESETRESAGRQGITPAAGDVDEAETADADEQQTTTTRNAFEEAALLDQE